jgi:hypothetical protein
MPTHIGTFAFAQPHKPAASAKAKEPISPPTIFFIKIIFFVK